MDKILGIALGLSLSGSAMATDYSVAIGNNGLNEYGLTAKGISTIGTYVPAIPIINGPYGCPATADIPVDVVMSSDASVAFALYKPCGAKAVIVEFGVTSGGLYERYQVTTLIGGLGNHNPQYTNMTPGPSNSLALIQVTPESPGNNEVVLYDNALRSLAAVYSSPSSTDIVFAKVDDSGKFFYICQSDGALYVNAFTAKSNVLIYTQPQYPVPYTTNYRSNDPLIYAAYCR